ncbi:MFS transporter [Altericroceibacterium spongiae]|uniref:MFS transporter n=1 Tax=Altericroceibacterium spongiae TaxID=2320269 RepID=A0A420EIS1_9SPHN|nr:MFS transporter [Altericroceibacterium spongiae]RKF20570.1 MFS transporter [Altericroceibacterium spongiae]
MSQAGAGRDTGNGTVPFYHWYALGILVLVYFLNFVDRQILSILANDIKADLALDDADLGFLYGTAFAIFYALFGIPLGRLADRWHRTRLLGIGLLLWSGMTALSGLARHGGALAVARIGVGVGEATANPCAYSLIGDWFPQRLRGTAVGIYSSGLFVGSGLSLVIGGTVVESWNAAFPAGGPLGLAGWQAAFLAVGLPGLLLSAWVFSLREPARPEGWHPAEAQWRKLLRDCADVIPPFTLLGAARRGSGALFANLTMAAVLALTAALLAALTGSAMQFWLLATGIYAVLSWALALRHDDPETFRFTWGSPAFMGIVVTYGAICFVGYSVTYWAAPFAERQFAVDKTELGWLLGAPAALGGFLGVIGGGRLADSLGNRIPAGRAIVLSIGLLLPVPLILIGYGTHSAVLFYAISFALQFATSTGLSASASASQALVKPHMRGTATAIFLIGTTLIGLALGPFTAGYVSTATGNLGTGVKAVLVAVPFGCFALWRACRAIPETARRLESQTGGV